MFDYKHADKVALQTEWKRIAELSNDDQFYTKKELNFLPELLQDNEEVLRFASGIMATGYMGMPDSWIIVLTDKRIIFINKGLIFGVKHMIINLDKVNAIEGETGLLLGSIMINDGAIVRKIENVSKSTVKPFTTKAQEAIANLKNVSTLTNTQPNESNVDIISQLERLASLKEKGILTEEEFKTQKSKILGN